MTDRLEPFEISVGDTRTPLYTILIQSGKPVNLTGLTAKFQMKSTGGESKVGETASNVTAHPTTTFTADAATDYLIADGHLVREGDQIVVSTTTTLPAGLAASTRYFAVQVRQNRFKLAAVEGETPVDITDGGTGTHSFYVVGSVQYAWQSANVDTTGAFKAWFTVFDGTDFDTFPNDGHIDVVIVER